jgi:FkbM family methyltransferase
MVTGVNSATTTRPTHPHPTRWRTRLADPVLRLLAGCTPWVERELLGLRHVVRPGAVCLDIGAASGYYSVVLSRLAGPSGTVHSIEPLVVAHPTLSALLGVRRRPIALGATSGRHWMSVPLRAGRPVTGRAFLVQGTSGLGSNDEFDDHLEIRVQADTLDAYCSRAGLDRLDFVKLDVEGGELAVLHGGVHTIDRDHPTLLLELEERHTRRYDHTPHDVVGWLTARGYRMHHWRAGRWHLTTRVTPTHRNYLFVAR